MLLQKDRMSFRLVNHAQLFNVQALHFINFKNLIGSKDEVVGFDQFRYEI